jgi:hypothetical protein
MTPPIGEEIMGKWSRRRSAPAIENVAGNGLIDRRALLGRGIAIARSMGAAAAATGAAAEPLIDAPWNLEFDQITPPVQTPSPFEKDVTRALSNPDGEFRTSHARTHRHAEPAAFLNQSLRHPEHRPGSTQTRHSRDGATAA